MICDDLCKKCLERILNNHTEKNSTSKVKEIKLKETAAEVTNLLGLVYRIYAVVVKKDQTETDISIILKKPPSHPLSKRILEETGAFEREIKMYSEILPIMEKQMRKAKDYMEPLWPECLTYRSNDTIVLEDLKSLGYKTMNQKTLINFNDALFIVKALARFHALAIVGRIPTKNDFGTHWFVEQTPASTEVFHFRLSKLLSLISITWGEEWQGLKNDLEILKETTMKRFKEIVKENKSVLNVLLHGDFRKDNILMRQCSLTEKINGIRFVDFQTTCCGSFAIDLQYFFYSSVEPKVFKAHYNELITGYYESLVKTFHLLDYEEFLTLPSIGDMKKEMEDFEFFGIFIAITILPLTLNDKTGSFEKESCLDEDDSEQGSMIKFSKEYDEAIKEILRPYIHSGFHKKE